MPFRHRLLKIYTKRFIWLTLLWWRFTMLCTMQRGVGMRIYEDPEDVLDALDFGKRASPDPFGGRLDVLRHPTWVQARIDKAPDGKLGDCEEHAVYLCATYRLLMKEVYLGVYQAVTQEGKIWGHAVCVYRPYGQDAYYVIDCTNPWMVKDPMDFVQASLLMGGRSDDTPLAAWLVPITGLSRYATPRFGKVKTRTVF